MQTARVRQPHGAGGLVEGFARRVVPRSAEDGEIGVIVHAHEVGVPAADDKAQKRRFQFRMGKIVRRDVPAQMVDRDQRQPLRVGEAFGVIHADKQRADQTGRIGHRDGVDAVRRRTCVVKRFLYHAADRFGVPARGDLGHHAAVKLMFLHLRRDHVRKHNAAVFHNGGGRFVAGGFNG